MTAGLQNGIRVRLFLIVLAAIGVRVAREYSSSSVHKGSGLLENNFYLYGILMFCSLLPYKNTWLVAIVAQAAATFLDIAAAGLGILATVRCRTQTGCIRTLPVSLVTLALVAVILVLDVLQTWDIYRVIRAPMFVSSSTQRIRILFSWALPFGWLINILMVADSQWSMFAFTTAHLVVDPLVILMANAKEDVFISTLIVIVIAMDILAYNMHTDTLAKKATIGQLGLAAGSLIIHVMAGPTTLDEALEEEEPMTDQEEEFEATESQALRHRKSGNDKIKF